MTWIIVGSSPTVVDHFDAAMAEYPDAMTFACNSAIKLFKDRRRPDYFIAVDETAGILLHALIEKAVDDGCEFVTYRKSLLERNREGRISLPGFEVKVRRPSIFLEVGEKVSTEYEPGKVVFAQYSGLAAMQYAIQQGAEQLVILGCDGYAGNRPLEDFPIVTFDGHGGDSWGARQTSRVIAPFMLSMIDQCPHIRFVQYGDPLYRIEAPNYEVRTGVYT